MDETLQDRADAVRARVAAACARAGRDVEDVSILPISKTFSPDAVREASEAGFCVFGENRVQEARAKIPLCPGHLEWHMVGHLQRNKVRVVVGLFNMIHSVDSWRLLEALERVCEEEGQRMPVCLEINVSGEGSKYGLKPEEVPALLEQSQGLMRVEICGLMTVPPFTPEPEDARPVFSQLRELRDRWRDASGYALDELSMGMSHDFEVAIEEGATWVRVGSALFGQRRGGAWKRSAGEGYDYG